MVIRVHLPEVAADHRVAVLVDAINEVLEVMQTMPRFQFYKSLSSTKSHLSITPHYDHL